VSAPSLVVRRSVYDRDGHRCAACHAADGLTFQHRRAVGMGGTRNRPAPTDGLTLCGPCNEACEHSMQTLALAFGWKVRRWADPVMVPCYYPHEFQWFRFEGTRRFPITAVLALDLMHAVYGDTYFQWRND